MKQGLPLISKFGTSIMLGAVLCFSIPSVASALVFGVTEGVTYKATDAELEAKFTPIAKALSEATGQDVTIQIISDYKELRSKLAKAEVDFAFVHPAHIALEAHKTGNYRIIAWTQGFTDYKVSVLCHKDMPILNTYPEWQFASKKLWVTPNPDSITSVMTKAMLHEKNITLDKMEMQLQSTRYQDAVPFYITNHFAQFGATASKSVVKGWIDGGGKICAQSIPIPIKHWLLSTKMQPKLAKNIEDTLLRLSPAGAGKEVLSSFGYKGFVKSDAAQIGVLTRWLSI